MLKLILLAIFSLVLSSGVFCQSSDSDTSMLTAKDKALKLLDSLDSLNNQQIQNSDKLLTQSEDSLTELKVSRQQVIQLKITLKEVVSSSTALEKSLTFSQMVNKIALPVGITAIAVATLETLYILFHK